MSDLRELYQSLIVDHSKKPRNFRLIEHSTHCGEGFNPLCGDRLKLCIKVESGVIEDISFEGVGCAISTASASLMTEALKSKTVDQAREVFELFHGMITSAPDQVAPELPELGKLQVFAGVREFPARVKCASLAWHTLMSALSQTGSIAKTE